MEILGYIAYGVLVFHALTWAFGVRTKLELGMWSIIGSLFFSLSAIIILLGDIQLIHSLWLIPLGYVIPLIVAYILPRSKLLAEFLMFIGSVYTGIIRIGIDKNKIKQAQYETAFEAIGIKDKIKQEQYKAKYEAIKNQSQKQE